VAFEYECPKEGCGYKIAIDESKLLQKNPSVTCPQCGSVIEFTWEGPHPQEVIDKAVKDLQKSIERANRKLKRLR